MSSLRQAILALLCLPAVAFAQVPATSSPPITVNVEGEVQRPAQFSLPPGSRISDAITSAQPSIDAYVAGAALLRPSLVEDQARLKAGLQYDLQELSKSENSSIAQAAKALMDWLTPLPVTGRMPRQLLELRLLQIQPRFDPIAQSGDHIIYPIRPSQISVVGAVASPCTMPHIPDQDVRTYLHDCPVGTAADKDNLYLIQPDGNVQVIGIALWNRHSSQPLAPGAVIYIPLAESVARLTDPQFNLQFAEFVATQILPTRGVSP